MKTISINLYEFGELNEKAQERAIDQVRNWVGESQAEIDGDAFQWTHEEMEKALGISIRFDSRSTNWYIGADGERWEDVLGDPDYLVRYLDWVDNRVDNRKAFWLPFEKSRYHHSTMTKRVSNVLANDYDHSLTGEWTDGAFCEFMRKRWDFVRDGWTIDRFVDALVCAFRKAWDEDIEWGYSDDNVREVITNNDFFLFKEDGTRYVD